MKRLLTLVAFFATVQASAQQVNPVPDYVFSNRMSAGRNTVTDTAAYFSIGPRYGATRGMMPPMVVDTASFSANKRNGLLIFSVQKNKFLYWDSVRVQWSDMAGSSGSYIVAGDTASMLSKYLRKSDTTAMLTPYVRHAGYGLTKSSQSFLVDTLNISTRAWRQKGIDSVRSIAVLLNGNQTVAGNKTFSNDIYFNGTTYHYAVSMYNSLTGYNHILYSKANAVNQFLFLPADTGTLLTDKTLQLFVSGTTNYIPKFTAGSTVGNSKLFDNGTFLGIATTSPSGTAAEGLNIFGSSAELHFTNTASGTTGSDGLTFLYSALDAYLYNYEAGFMSFGTSGTERLRIFANGRIGINTTTDAGYQLDVNGTARINNALQVNKSDGGQAINIVGNSNTASIQQNGSDMYFNSNTNTTGGGFFFRNSSSFTTRMAIDASGNVGIGTASPTQRLDVSGYAIAGVTDRTLIGQDGTYTGYSTVGFGGVGNGSNRVFGSSSSADGLYLAAATGRGITFRVNGTDIASMFINSLGNVGIGTTSPAQKLDVSGVIRANSGTIFAQASGTESSGYQLNAITLGYDATNAVGWITAGGAAARTNLVLQEGSGGELLIGTKTDAGDYKLQVAGNIYGSSGANLAMTSGNVGVGLVPAGQSGFKTIEIGGTGLSGLIDVYQGTNRQLRIYNSSIDSYLANNANGGWMIFRTTTSGGTQSNALSITDASELLVNTSTDAGDYKLQVSGNALVTAGKLDITTNTAFGLSVSRSGTSVVAGQINNSNGILYYGAESSTGGSLFTGSSAYAAVIGSGAAYPLQFATDNVTRATINTNGELLINTLTDNGDFKLQVNGSALISGSIQTANPVSGTAVPWRLGSVVATNVQLDTGNYVEVNINGTFYRLAIVTPL